MLRYLAQYGSNGLTDYLVFFLLSLPIIFLSLSLHETSEPIRITTGTGDGFFILFCMQKSEQHFEDCYDDIKDAYEENEIGKMLSTRAAELKAGVSYTSEYSALVHADIKMNEASEQ